MHKRVGSTIIFLIQSIIILNFGVVDAEAPYCQRVIERN